MKDAEYYIDLVFNHYRSHEEWMELFEEGKEWLKYCSPEQELVFAQSGAGEMLYMICD